MQERFLLLHRVIYSRFFFFQAEDGIRDLYVTGVQTCALPIWLGMVSVLRKQAAIYGPPALRAPQADLSGSHLGRPARRGSPQPSVRCVAWGPRQASRSCPRVSRSWGVIGWKFPEVAFP